jgi:hypothetical protein
MAIPEAYINNVANLTRSLEGIRTAGVPDRVVVEFLKTLGFKSSNDRPIITVGSMREGSRAGAHHRGQGPEPGAPLWDNPGTVRPTASTPVLTDRTVLRGGRGRLLAVGEVAAAVGRMGVFIVNKVATRGPDTRARGGWDSWSFSCAFLGSGRADPRSLRGISSARRSTRGTGRSLP